MTVDTTDDGLRITTDRADDVVTDLLVALRDAGITISGFDIEAATLDDVFLAIADERTDGLDAADRDGSET